MPPLGEELTGQGFLEAPPAGGPEAGQGSADGFFLSSLATSVNISAYQPCRLSLEGREGEPDRERKDQDRGAAVIVVQQYSQEGESGKSKRQVFLHKNNKLSACI